MKLIIGAKFDGVHQVNFEVDILKSKTVTSSAQIATQPLQNGTTMSDHMWSNPDSVSISGKFGLNGMKSIIDGVGTEYIADTAVDDVAKNAMTSVYDPSRLARVQKVFEYIKENGILCDISTIEEGKDNEVIFNTRQNMALQNITWNEGVNSMDFTFTFQEVIMVQVQEYEVDTYSGDADNPSTTLPAGTTLGQYVAETGNIEQSVTEALATDGYIAKEDLSGAALKCNEANKLNRQETTEEVGQVLLIVFAAAEVVVVAALATLVYVGVLTASAAVSYIFPVGTAIAAATAIIASIVFLVHKICKNKKEKEKAKKAFKLFNNSTQYFNSDGSLKEEYQNGTADIDLQVNEYDIHRLAALYDSIKNVIRTTGRSTVLYALTTTEDDYSDKEVALTIGSNIYYISFRFHYEDLLDDLTTKIGTWNWKVVDSNGDDLIGTNGRVISESNYITEFDEANIYSNGFFYDATQNYNVFIFNPSMNSENLVSDNKDEEKIVKSKLMNYYIVVCQGDLQEQGKSVYEAVYSALQSEGFI